MAKKMTHERYREWWDRRSAAEFQLQSVAFACEETYFADLRLLTASIRKRLLRYEIQLDDGRWVETEDDTDVSLSDWIFRVRRMGTNLGLCNRKLRTIYVAPGLDKTEHRATLLHEIIHAYEFQLSPSFREWLVLELYKRMLTKIDRVKLNRWIDASTHLLSHECTHGVLFLLKSLDLDIRLGWKLGTVFGYGRQDFRIKGN